MIVVSKQQQLATHDIGLQFLTNIIGSKKAPRVLAFFTSINSLGNIIGMTFAASRVKQEVAKEGVIPFAKFFGENRTLLHPRKSHDEHALDSDAEPTPLGALFLHWMFAMILIIATWPAKPSNAYQILVNLYTYVTDVIPNTIMGVGIICLRLFTNWSEKSPLPRWISYSSAIIFTLTNGFPLVAVWVPPAKDSFEIPGFPWYMTGALSWAMVTFSILYWFAFRYVWPRIGSRKGKEFVVEREPVFRVVNGERVLWHEIVLHSWVVKDEPERRNTYALDDI
jgi:amino acid transporter